MALIIVRGVAQIQIDKIRIPTSFNTFVFILNISDILNFVLGAFG